MKKINQNKLSTLIGGDYVVHYWNGGRTVCIKDFENQVTKCQVFNNANLTIARGNYSWN